jgi:NDP-sugar pyrophosphorylase family protein
MKAMVLAAGLGTRLRPLTDDRPKALVEVSGRTMLEITLARLRAFGMDDVIVNAHHFADKLIEYLRAHANFGMNIEVSREDVLLDTGGGLKKAAHFFAGSGEPFLLHNVDVLSNIDFAQMLEVHRKQRALATLAVQDRPGSRRLLFNDRLQLCGRQVQGASDEIVQTFPGMKPLAFAGIHVISPAIFEHMTEEGVFSIIATYLRLAGEGAPIVGFRADDNYWRDLGKPESIRQAEEDVRAGLWRAD